MFAESGIAGYGETLLSGLLATSTEKRESESERETDDGFAIVTAVLMSVPDRQQGMDDINRTIQCEYA